MNTTTVYFRFFASDFYVDEGELKLAVEDQNMNLIRKAEYVVKLEAHDE